MIAITGATGQLGTLVVEALLAKLPAGQLVAAVRNPAKATPLSSKGLHLREADYSRPETLAAAFAGVDQLLLISSSEMGNRVAQHKAVIDAARAAGVRHIAYTSLLHADTSPLALAADHVATEQHLAASGLRSTFLRNGWYFENQTAGIAPALQQGAFIGASKDGLFAAASRQDFAEAAAAVLTSGETASAIYELAGDVPYTRADLAAEVSRQTGKPIAYQDLPEAEYAAILSTFLPPALATILADAEAQAANGALNDDSHTLSRLIGRPTTTLAAAVTAALQA